MSISPTTRRAVTSAPSTSLSAPRSPAAAESGPVGHSAESSFEPAAAFMGTSLIGGLVGCGRAPEDPRLTQVKAELAKAPSGSRAAALLEYLNANDVDIQFRQGDGAEYSGGVIYLDATCAPVDNAISLSHELVHRSDPTPDSELQTKEKFLQMSLAEEKRACHRQFEVANDLGVLQTSQHPAVRYFVDECGGDLNVWNQRFDAGDVLTAKGPTYVDNYKHVYELQTGKPF